MIIFRDMGKNVHTIKLALLLPIILMTVINIHVYNVISQAMGNLNRMTTNQESRQNRKQNVLY